MTDVDFERGQRSAGLNGHQQPHHGKSVEWYTPPEIFEALDVEFDLDPASPPGGLPWVPARKFIDVEQDGLKSPWLGFIWLNPPFGADVVHWMRRMARHDHGIALVAARCNTRWWHETVGSAKSICMLPKRPYFVNVNRERAPFNSGADIVLIAYGQRGHDVLSESGLGMMAKL